MMRFMRITVRGDQIGGVPSIRGLRDLIDQPAAHPEVETDPFFQHVVVLKDGSGRPYDALGAKRDLYRPGSI